MIEVKNQLIAMVTMDMINMKLSSETKDPPPARTTTQAFSPKSVRRISPREVIFAACGVMLFHISSLGRLQNNVGHIRFEWTDLPPCMEKRAPLLDGFCFPWSFQTDSWWAHHPEWFNVLNNETHTCFERHTDEKAQFYLRMYENQWKSDCRVVHSRTMWNSGWGADLSNVVDGVLTGLVGGQPLVMKNRSTFGWHYANLKGNATDDTAACSTRDMFCYFLPLSNCQNDKNFSVVSPKMNAANKYLFAAKYRDWAYNYITRQKQQLRKEVTAYLAKVQPRLSGACAAIHVRRADVVLHGKYSRKYHAISDYVNLLPENRKQDIVIFTDDANAIDEAHDVYPTINWHYLNRTRYRGAEGGWEQQTPSKNPKQETIVILSILELAKKCDTFVYGKSSFANLILNSMRSFRNDDVRGMRVDIGRSENNSLLSEKTR